MVVSALYARLRLWRGRVALVNDGMGWEIEPAAASRLPDWQLCADRNSACEAVMNGQVEKRSRFRRWFSPGDLDPCFCFMLCGTLENLSIRLSFARVEARVQSPPRGLWLCLHRMIKFVAGIGLCTFSTKELLIIITTSTFASTRLLVNTEMFPL